MKKFVKPLVAALFAVLSAASSFAAVDINKASQVELERIKGIGPSMSARILDARKAGAFKDWSDLQSRVKGVRDKTSVKFSGEGLTVNGAAYAGGNGAKLASVASVTKPVKSPAKPTHPEKK